MLYKKLGKTGKDVSAVGFGCMRFKPEEYSKGPEKCAELILRAVELGINYIDTAPGYCNDMSEKIVGCAFRQMKHTPFVSTKCGLWLADDADGARRFIDQSISRLGVDKITVYNLWCIRTLDEYREMTKKGGIYDGILRAKEEGLIEHICCSTHLDGDGIAKIAADGKVESVTLGYNALNFAYRRGGVKVCYANGIGVAVMNPLGGGLIPRHPEKFGFIKSNPAQSLADAALRFLIGQKEISITLPGISSMDELREAVAAADNVAEINEETLTKMSSSLSHELDTLCTGCSYCDECPEGVEIPKLMDVYNEVLLGGNMQSALFRLGEFWGLSGDSAKACIQCGKCEKICTQKLPIIDRLAKFTEN